MDQEPRLVYILPYRPSYYHESCKTHYDRECAHGHQSGSINVTRGRSMLKIHVFLQALKSNTFFYQVRNEIHRASDHFLSKPESAEQCTTLLSNAGKKKSGFDH